MPETPLFDLESLAPARAGGEAGPEGAKAVKLPGPKAKQAEALYRNVEWLCRTFGENRVGFLTLTCGDTHKNALMPDGVEFKKIENRYEAERRVKSLMQNIISKRYQAGVIVRERHKDKGIHYHLIVVHDEDIRTGASGTGTLDFEKVFAKGTPRNGKARKEKYASANDAIKSEWAFWRRHAQAYGFGRCQMQPVKKNGEAVARYLGGYVSKGWFARLPEDKGARLLRYFGDWNAKPHEKFHDPKLKNRRAKRWVHPIDCEKCILKIKRKAPRHHQNCAACLKRLKLIAEKIPVKMAPPTSAKFGWVKPFATAWRLACGQMEIMTAHGGERITPNNVKDKMGRGWALKFTKKLKNVQIAEESHFTPEILETVRKHNQEVADENTVKLMATSNSPEYLYPNYKHMTETGPEYWKKPPVERIKTDLENRRENATWGDLQAAIREICGEIEAENNSGQNIGDYD